MQIVGETEVYGKIKSDYKVKLSNKIEATKFFKLVKALFIVQSELPNYYEFQTRIDKQGSLEFYYNDQLMKYDELSNWVNDEYRRLLDMEKKVVEKNNSLQEKLSKLKKQSQELDIEYLSKEKQISTFLECKKTFFGKVKYFFKYSGKKNKVKEKVEKTKVDEIKIVKEKIEENLKVQYTLEELIQKGKETLEKENNLKNTKMDINALKLKNLNLTKKIENATAFIEEIDSHKKSIFEFWKYSNKDEVQALEEGEKEQESIKPHSKVFDYEEDFEEFGETMDEIQRKILSKEELDDVYLTTTNQLEVINKLKTESPTAKELEQYMKKIKKDLQEEKDITEEDVIDIFGGLSEDTRKITKLANKSHREHPKNKYAILRVAKSMKTAEYRAALENAINIIDEALEKNALQQDIAGYKWVEEEENIDTNEFNVFNLNPEKEIENALTETESGKVNLYKMNFNKVDDFLDDLKSSNYLAKPNKKIDKDTCEFKFTLYLCEAKQSNDEISWNWLLNEFDESPLYVYKSPRAILFIEKVCDEREDIYAATFGSSFFKVDKYCDRDFGFKFAARMEYTNIKTTTLTSPNSKRSKMINTYVDYNEFDFNSGESFAKLKVNAKLDENFDLFKPALEIGNSIRFNTDKANIDGIINIILYVEKILEISDNDVKYKIPLFKEVKNEESIKKLNESLNKAIQSNVLGDSKCNLLSVPEIDIIGASEVFNGNDNEFELIY